MSGQLHLGEVDGEFWTQDRHERWRGATRREIKIGDSTQVVYDLTDDYRLVYEPPAKGCSNCGHARPAILRELDQSFAGWRYICLLLGAEPAFSPVMWPDSFCAAHCGENGTAHPQPLPQAGGE